MTVIEIPVTSAMHTGLVSYSPYTVEPLLKDSLY